VSAPHASHAHDHHDEGHDHGHGGHHISSLGTYLSVFGALLVLTVVTVMVSYMGLPSTLSIVVAMIVASVKASLVCAWFMHLKYDVKFNVLVFLSAVWFAALFFIFTMIDLGSRGAIMHKTDNFVLRADRAGVVDPLEPPKGKVGGNYWKVETLRKPAVLFASSARREADLNPAPAAAVPADAPAHH
jgi:caa(3)-type oxidase subunit IV